MTTVVIGAQWGDEGKGKIVDFLAEDAEDVVRFSGGANAGHTIVKHGEKFTLHLVPSGILYDNTVVVLGIGMVIDIPELFSELETLESQGITWKGRVLISDRAHVVLPNDRDEDRSLDEGRRRPIGTTGRGIGVAYARKAARDGVRVSDLIFHDTFFDLPTEEQNYFAPYRERLGRMACDLTDRMISHRDRRTLLEGAQGVMLDLDLGTYPFVSSGMSAAAGAVIGGGIGPGRIDRVLGVFKAYSTRVGNGPFPSEFSNERDGDLGERIREIGQEYGATTGRARRCGHLDLVALRYACIANGIDGLVLTHLDVYDTFDEISVCTAYEINGRRYHTVPANIRELEKAEPVIETLRGWKRGIGSASSYEELPGAAQDYIRFIESFVETPIDVVSVGSDREQTIIRRSPWIR